MTSATEKSPQKNCMFRLGKTFEHRKDLDRQPRNTGTYAHRILIGTPTLGQVRIEWHNAMNGLVIPVNWSNSCQTPIGFQVDDAQNVIVKESIDKGFEWTLFIEDDVIPPPDLFLRFSPYMEKKTIPIVSGWYNLKSRPPQPLMFRGRGTGSFNGWKPGDKVWCDGVPTGCLLVHNSVLAALSETAETYTLRSNGEIVKLKRIFKTPRITFSDAPLGSYHKLVGTSDLFFCDQIIREKTFEKAGWKAKKPWPFLVDTAIRCGHIDRSTGEVF